MSEPGSAADEAAHLFAAAEQWLRTRTGVLLDEEHLANGSAACAVCPVCQAVAAVRQVKPETVEHLLDAAASLVAALRTTVVGGGSAGGSAGASTRSPVEHIDVREGPC